MHHGHPRCGVGSQCVIKTDHTAIFAMLRDVVEDVAAKVVVGGDELKLFNDGFTQLCGATGP